jgi:hypothetical protein
MDGTSAVWDETGEESLMKQGAGQTQVSPINFERARAVSQDIAVPHSHGLRDPTPTSHAEEGIA